MSKVLNMFFLGITQQLPDRNSWRAMFHIGKYPKTKLPAHNLWMPKGLKYWEGSWFKRPRRFLPTMKALILETWGPKLLSSKISKSSKFLLKHNRCSLSQVVSLNASKIGTQAQSGQPSSTALLHTELCRTSGKFLNLSAPWFSH